MIARISYLRRSRALLLVTLSGFFLTLSLILWVCPAVADGPSLDGVGGMAIVYNPHDGYVYVLNSNDSVSVVDGTQVVNTIDLPTGGYARLTDLEVAPNGDVYVSQWFYDQVVVLRDGQIHAIVPRQDDGRPGANGVENGPTVVAANPANNLIYVATSWIGEPRNNGVTVVSGTQVVDHVPTGLYPQAVGVNPDTGRVYVANALSDTVTVVSGTAVVKHIPVGDYPAALGVDLVHSLVYVANRDSGTVTVIDEGTLTATVTISAGVGPMAMHVDSQAALAYVVNHDGDTVAVVDGLAMTHTAKLDVGGSPIAVASDPASGLLYVANQMSNTVSAIQNSVVTATLSVGSGPVALAWDPDDGLYVLSFQDATLSLITGTTMVETIGGLPRLAHTSIESLPNGHTVVADLTGQRTWFLDGADVVTTVATLDGPFPLWDTPARAPLYDHLLVAHESVAVDNQGRVFVGNREDESVSVITEEQGRQQIVGVYGKPYDLVAVPSSGRVYAAVWDGVAVLQGSPTVTATHLNPPELANARVLAAWPEQERVYVSHDTPGGKAQVAIVDDSTLMVTHVIDVCDGPAAMDVDRDQGLVYITCGGSNSVGVISDTTWLGEVPVGQFPQGVAVNSENGYAYVATMLANHVAVLDGPELLTTISVPEMPIAVDVDRVTGYVFVTCELGDAVAVISGTELLTTIPTGEFPNAVRVVTGTVYVGNAHSADVDVFQFEEIAADPGNEWTQASPIIAHTAYAAPIESEEDIDWYKIHLAEPGSVITIGLGGLPADYDLAFFSSLTDTEEITATVETLDLGQVLEDGRLGSLSGWMDLGRLRALVRGGAHIGGNNLLRQEIVSNQVWESGDYYIAVWGHNGAHSDQSYVLRTQVSTPTDVITLAHPITPTSVPPPVDDSVRVLIVTHSGRLGERYGISQTAVLTSHLVTLTQAVSGTVVYLEDHADAVEAYAQWDSLPENPRAANFVADIIKHILGDMLAVSYPNAQYIVLVGNDNIVPFRRVPDLTMIANERRYNAGVRGDSPMAARIRNGYLLSDDFYASYHPLRRGRELYIPEYAIGRLVEIPEEMVAAIDAYLVMGPSATVTTALVTGYDFLIDEAQAISHTLGSSGITVTHLITEGWTANQLRPLLLDSDHGLFSLNGHFNHRLLVAGDVSTAISRTEIVSAEADYANDLVFSIGCQSGLNVPDEDALGGETAWTLDFAQAFLQRGAVYIANTGYGYGDSDTIGYSEALALKLTEQLAGAGGAIPVGQALLQAKQAYYADVGYASFGDYDEKALIGWTLYGLPMLEVEMGQRPEESPCYRVGVSPSADNGFYATQSITISDIAFELMTSTRTIAGSPTFVGNYYRLCDDAQVNPGRPVQPRINVDLRAALPAGQVVHGALFVGGEYIDVEGFDPVVSRIVSDTAATEPPFGFQRWYPSPLHVVNRLQLGREALSEKLVVMPAQYLAADEIIGTERLYTELRYDMHYSATGTIDDFLPPAIWRVEVITTGQTIGFRVRVTDPSGIDRVVVAYDDGAGKWHTFDLDHLGGNQWSQEIALSMAHCFVQAVDKAGNVALSDNKGINFTVVGLSLGPTRSGEAKPGESETFYHTLTNRGAGKDTFVLTPDSYPSWLVELSPSAVTLEPADSTNVTVTVTTPGAALSGTKHVVTVTAMSLSNQDVSAIVTDTMVVGQVAGVALAPHRDGRGRPDSVITFIHTLTNKGNGRDTFTLAASGESQINPPATTLEVDETTTITVAVTVPYVLSGTTVSTAITATSSFDPAVYGMITDTTTVSQTFGVALSQGLSVGRRPGEYAIFTHTITNTGNWSDTFAVEASSLQGWPLEMLGGGIPTRTLRLPLSLEMGTTGTAQISITVPITATVGTTDTVTVGIASSSDPQVTGTIVNTVIVVPERVYLPVVLRSR